MKKSSSPGAVAMCFGWEGNCKSDITLVYSPADSLASERHRGIPPVLSQESVAVYFLHEAGQHGIVCDLLSSVCLRCVCMYVDVLISMQHVLAIHGLCLTQQMLMKVTDKLTKPQPTSLF